MPWMATQYKVASARDARLKRDVLAVVGGGPGPGPRRFAVPSRTARPARTNRPAG